MSSKYCIDSSRIKVLLYLCQCHENFPELIIGAFPARNWHQGILHLVFPYFPITESHDICTKSQCKYPYKYIQGLALWRMLMTGVKLCCKFAMSFLYCHYNDVIMSGMASQITSLTIVYSTFYSGVDQIKHQSPASLAFVWRIHRWPVNSPHKWPVTRKMFPFDDVIMKHSNH